MKYFIITIDTEGDDLWSWSRDKKITTQNVDFLERFQTISNHYGFFPVWLTNHEMISDDKYVDFIYKVEEAGLGELGMHLHAWNSPPIFELPHESNGNPYLIEYPPEIIEQKILFITEEIEKKTGIKPVSHRAGRWATNDLYFKLLVKYGYLCDCSVTPFVDWSSSPGQTKESHGSDYSHIRKGGCFSHKGILEVPVTIMEVKRFFLPEFFNLRSIAKSFYHGMQKKHLWLRPNGSNLKQMKYLIDSIKASQIDYAMFMLHSSELMPGGSPAFKSKESIEKLYDDISELFAYVSRDFRGITLRDYYRIKTIG